MEPITVVKPFSTWVYRPKTQQGTRSVGSSRYIVLTVAVVSSEVWEGVGCGRAVVYFPACSPGDHRVCTEEEFHERFVEDE